jgi:hypothetical protein
MDRKCARALPRIAKRTAYAWAFLLLCGLHAFTFFSAIQLPRRLV